jgi:hypothetical protein
VLFVTKPLKRRILFHFLPFVWLRLSESDRRTTGYEPGKETNFLPYRN